MNLRNILAGAASINFATIYLPPASDTQAQPSWTPEEARERSLGQLAMFGLGVLSILLAVTLGTVVDVEHGLLGGALFIAALTVPSALLWLVSDELSIAET